MQSVYSRQASNGQREFERIFRRNPHLFALDEFEAQQLKSLLRRGYAFAPGFFSKALVDHIHMKTEAIFRARESPRHTGESEKQEQVNETSSPSSYPASAEHPDELEYPLVHIPEVLDIAFHESILKVAAHFFKQIPPTYRVSLVRYVPSRYAPHLSKFRQETDDSDSLQILIDLVSVDETSGPLVYVPGSNLHGSFRPPLLNAFGLPVNPRLLEDKEVESRYPRDTWVALCGERGSVTSIDGKGLNKGPAWTFPGDPDSKPRTVIRIDARGYGPGAHYDQRGNIMRKWNFGRMSKFQQVLAHAAFVEEQMLA